MSVKWKFEYLYGFYTITGRINFDGDKFYQVCMSFAEKGETPVVMNRIRDRLETIKRTMK